MFGYGFSLILCLPFVHLRQKRGVFFVFGPGMYFQTGQVFLSLNGQRGSLLVFYVGDILVDKNTLCNGFILNWFIGFMQSHQVIWTTFISSHVTGHKFLEDVHEDSMQFPSQINWFLCNRSDGPLKGSECPTVSRSFNVEDVRTSGQPTSSSTRNWISVDTVWEVSARCPDEVATRLDTTQHSIIFWVSFTDVERSDSEDVWTLGQAVRTWTCYGKNRAILERRSQKTVRTRLTSVRTPTR
jgi:hypothetical protein